MRHWAYWLAAIGLAAITITLAGCGTITNTQTLPRHLTCTGKGSIVGSVSGFAGVNLAIDCGDGLTFDTGPDITPPTPVKP
jgi:hypothetical protein